MRRGSRDYFYENGIRGERPRSRRERSACVDEIDCLFEMALELPVHAAMPSSLIARWMPKRPASKSASSAKKKSTTVSYSRLRSAPS